MRGVLVLAGKLLPQDAEASEREELAAELAGVGAAIMAGNLSAIVRAFAEVGAGVLAHAPRACRHVHPPTCMARAWHVRMACTQVAGVPDSGVLAVESIVAGDVVGGLKGLLPLGVQASAHQHAPPSLAAALTPLAAAAPSSHTPCCRAASRASSPS